MHLEQLTKTQIVLLALLVAVVSATASAIVTVALVSQAPPTVAATVDQIIEKTVEQIVPSATSTAPAIKTVIVNTSEEAPAAVAQVQKSIIRIVVQGDPEDSIVARGIIVSARGIAMTSAGALDPTLSYSAILPNGSRASVSVNDASSTTAFSTITLTSASTTAFIPATIADPNKLQLGESVIRIGGAAQDTAATGIISALPSSDAPTMIQSDTASKVPGSVLIDFTGAVIGMTTETSVSLGETYYSLLTNK